ncbi:right-handed parallel beta-helix repeat-containing protein [Chloroflexota bacterium]
MGLLPNCLFWDGNGKGVEIYGGASDNIVSDNLIMSNTEDGIHVAGSGTGRERIRDNQIGEKACPMAGTPSSSGTDPVPQP